MENTEVYHNEYRLKPIFRYVLIIFYIFLTVLLFSSLLDIWNSPEYSKVGLVVFLIIPILALVLFGMSYAIKVTVVLDKNSISIIFFKTKQIYYKDIKRVQIGKNYFKIISTNNKVLIVGNSYQSYEVIKEQLLLDLESIENVDFIYLN